jgi:ketosteroid isomerase-like protein
LRHAVVVLLLVLCPSGAAAPGDVADAAAAAAVVEEFFGAMKAQDTAALRRTMLPAAVLVNPLRRDGAHVQRVLDVASLSRMVMEAPEPYDERMPDPDVRVDTDLAHVWGRYTFRVGARLTNCGRNSFQLLRTDEGWRIAHIASTIETTGCEAS